MPPACAAIFTSETYVCKRKQELYLDQLQFDQREQKLGSIGQTHLWFLSGCRPLFQNDKPYPIDFERNLICYPFNPPFSVQACHLAGAVPVVEPFVPLAFLPSFSDGL